MAPSSGCTAYRSRSRERYRYDNEAGGRSDEGYSKRDSRRRRRKSKADDDYYDSSDGEKRRLNRHETRKADRQDAKKSRSHARDERRSTRHKSQDDKGIDYRTSSTSHLSLDRKYVKDDLSYERSDRSYKEKSLNDDGKESNYVKRKDYNSYSDRTSRTTRHSRSDKDERRSHIDATSSVNEESKQLIKLSSVSSVSPRHKRKERSSYLSHHEDQEVSQYSPTDSSHRETEPIEKIITCRSESFNDMMNSDESYNSKDIIQRRNNDMIKSSSVLRSSQNNSVKSSRISTSERKSSSATCYNPKTVSSHWRESHRKSLSMSPTARQRHEKRKEYLTHMPRESVSKHSLDKNDSVKHSNSLDDHSYSTLKERQIKRPRQDNIELEKVDSIPNHSIEIISNDDDYRHHEIGLTSIVANNPQDLHHIKKTFVSQSTEHINERSMTQDSVVFKQNDDLLSSTESISPLQQDHSYVDKIARLEDGHHVKDETTTENNDSIEISNKSTSLNTTSHGKELKKMTRLERIRKLMEKKKEEGLLMCKSVSESVGTTNSIKTPDLLIIKHSEKTNQLPFIIPDTNNKEIQQAIDTVPFSHIDEHAQQVNSDNQLLDTSNKHSSTISLTVETIQQISNHTTHQTEHSASSLMAFSTEKNDLSTSSTIIVSSNNSSELLNDHPSDQLPSDKPLFIQTQQLINKDAGIIDSLDAFMAAIATEVEELQNSIGKKPQKRRRKKNGGVPISASVKESVPIVHPIESSIVKEDIHSIEDVPPTLPMSITLDEILELQKQHLTLMNNNESMSSFNISHLKTDDIINGNEVTENNQLENESVESGNTLSEQSLENLSIDTILSLNSVQTKKREGLPPIILSESQLDEHIKNDSELLVSTSLITTDAYHREDDELCHSMKTDNINVTEKNRVTELLSDSCCDDNTNNLINNHAYHEESQKLSIMNDNNDMLSTVCIVNQEIRVLDGTDEILSHDSIDTPCISEDSVMRHSQNEDESYYLEFIKEMRRKQDVLIENDTMISIDHSSLIPSTKTVPVDNHPMVETSLVSTDIKESVKETNSLNEGTIEVYKDEVIDNQDDEDYRYNVATEDGSSQSYFDLVQKVGNKKDLPIVDHSKVVYNDFRKNLYVQVREITIMKDHEIDALRKLHGGIRIRGKCCPRPVLNFYQCGLPDIILKVIEKRDYDQPFPIQMQAIPALMAGRDVIGIAETGSGKTLAYLLPVIRHILDQPPLKTGEGPIALLLAPTRELAVQIQKEAHRYTKLVGLRSIAVYGGTGIGEQLSALKRGAEVIVATPGRLIDVLTINSGKVTNLRRVTFCVLDEADRMFDMGFEPQITSIMKNIRPDRQTALFSATFPPLIESLARRILKKPIEITVGSKGQSASQIEQYVEVWVGYREKFLRLLQLLGEWSEHGSIIIFVARQNEADELFAELLKFGYSSLVLHGGQDQTDRDFTVQDFKDGAKTILIATSVAARGLDVKSVVLVINFVAPDHLEDYVHRIGRTGRAGNIGVAYTFLSAEDADKADDLIKALKQSGKDVPASVQELADEFRVKCNMGLARQRTKKGFGGKGFKFTAAEKSRQQQDRQRAKKEMGMNESDDDEEVLQADSDDLENPMAPMPPPSSQALLSGLSPTGVPNSSNISGTGDDVGAASARAKALADMIAKQTGMTNVPHVSVKSIATLARLPSGGEEKARQVAALRNSIQQQLAGTTPLPPATGGPGSVTTTPSVVNPPAAAAAAAAQRSFAQALAIAAATGVGATGLQHSGLPLTIGNVPGLSSFAYIDPATGNAVDEFDINDYPQYARFKITHKDVLHRISDQCGAVLQVKGRYVPAEEKDSPVMIGVKHLYIEIIGSTPIVIQRAKHEIRSLLETISLKQLNTAANARPTGRYSVV